MPTVLKKILKVLLWIVVSIFCLLILIVILIRLPSVQNYIVGKIVPVVEEKTGTTVDIDRVYISFPKNVTVEGLYVEDQRNDTLVNIGYLDVNIGLFGLLSSEVNIDNVRLENSTVNLFKDSTSGKFNFDFIIESFAGDSTQKQDTSQSPWTIKAGGLELENFRFTYNDQTSLMKVNADIPDFNLDINNFNLDSLTFGADDFELTGARVKVTSFGGSETEVDTAANDENGPTPLTLNVDNLTVEDSYISYQDSSQKAIADIGELLLEKNSFSLSEQNIGSNSIELNNSFVTYQILDQDTTSSENQASKDTTTSEPWKINVDAINLSSNKVRYDNEFLSTDSVVEGMDYNHIHLDSVNGQVQNVKVIGSDVAAKVESFTFKDKSGFALNDFQTDFQMQDQLIDADNVHLETNASSLSATAKFYYSSFIEHTGKENSSEIKISDASISPDDILFFAPQLEGSLPSSKIMLKGEVLGWLDKLDINNLSASIENTSLQMQGSLAGLPEMNRFYFDVPKLKFKGHATTIKNMLPDSTLPSSIQLPDDIDLEANVSGHLTDLKGSLSGVTSMGNLYFEGSFANDTIEKYVDVNGDLEIEQFDVGKLTGNQQIGKLQANFSVDGAGETVANTDIDVSGNIALLQYNSYDYENLKIDGHVRGKSYRGQLSSEDKNLWFYFKGLVNMQDSIPEFDLRLDLINADLQALNFMPNRFVTSGVIEAKIKADEKGRINGNASIKKAKIIKNNEFFELDSVVAVSISEERKTDINLQSGILDAKLKGNIDVLQIGNILKRHLNQYFTKDQAPDTTGNELQQFDFSVDIKDPTLLTDVLLPQLQTFQVSSIEGSFNNQQDRLSVDVKVPEVVYGSFQLDTLKLSINTDAQELTGSLTFALLKNSFLYIDNFKLSAVSATDALNLLVNIPMKNKKDFQLGTKLYRKDSSYFLSLRPESLVFNGNQWTAPADNYLKLGNGIWFHDFTMQNANKHLTLNTALTENNDTTLNLEFQNFDLKALTEPLSDTASLASGIANGNVQLLSENAGLSLNSKLNIRDLRVMDNPFGNLDFNNKYRNEENQFTLALKGQNIDMEAEGSLKSLDTTTNVEANADINKLDLSSVYPFVKEYFSKLDGQISGNIDFKTAENFPEIDGAIDFKNVDLKPLYTGVEVKIDGEQLKINNENLVLNDFRIDAVDNGYIVLNGNLNARDFPNYKLSMDVSADNFLVLNTTQEDNDTYYGKLIISGGANVQGDQDLLNVKANVDVDGGSNLTYVVPQEQGSVISEEGLVRYINVKGDTSLMAYEKAREDTATAKIQGLDLTANISINKQSSMSIIIDQQTGDRLDVSGDADLTLAMPPNGDMTLTGRYEISEGSYKLNFYEFVKRDFQIVKGSYILWTGDPLGAQLDVTTRYKVETLPPVGEINKKLPFYVNLNISNEILDPRLSFRLALPEDLQSEYGGVSSFLQTINNEETELNKQVFSLIVFNSFMISGGTGSGDLVSNTARQSLSKILSQQLNKLAGNVNFVDLDLNLESYETGNSGSAKGRTDLQLGLSKSLFNNRLTIRVESDINLEGDEKQRQQQQGVSGYTGDIVIEYKLTKDGVYRLQLFSKDEYDALNQGDITKTGVGVIMIRDYNKLKDLFKREEEVEVK